MGRRVPPKKSISKAQGRAGEGGRRGWDQLAPWRGVVSKGWGCSDLPAVSPHPSICPARSPSGPPVPGALWRRGAGRREGRSLQGEEAPLSRTRPPPHFPWAEATLPKIWSTTPEPRPARGPSPRDTQEPITGLWVRGAGRSCLVSTGPGAARLAPALARSLARSRGRPGPRSRPRPPPRAACAPAGGGPGGPGAPPRPIPASPARTCCPRRGWGVPRGQGTPGGLERGAALGRPPGPQPLGTEGG